MTLVLGKGAAGMLGHSYALVADAIESATGIVSSRICVAGAAPCRPGARRKPSLRSWQGRALGRHFGVRRADGAAAFIAYESIQHIQTPHALPARFTLAVLAVIIAIKETLYRRVLRVGQEVDSAAVKAVA